MDYANAIVKTAKAFYDAINPATLSGAIDVIVVEQPDGQLKATPFHIRFGKAGVWSLTDKYVDIEINGDDIDLKMKLGATGVVYSNTPDAVPPLVPQLEPAQLATPVPISQENPPPIIAGPESPKLNASTEDGAVFSTSTNEAVKDDAGSTNGLLYSSLRLSSDRLKSLGLKYGANEARFSITTMYQGTSWCSCNIYLYKWNEQLVVSDIDGTITKSDVLGHVIPVIGGTWAHTGVADLYTRIIENGYKVVYLSSRAIGQSYMTKQYLKTVVQGSRRLPDGPVLLSPSSVLMAFRLEVIDRKPDEFKIAALKDLKKLFPVEQPFYAGFGNRETDVKSYRAVNIPPTRILIVDPSGHVRGGDSVGYVSCYKYMADTADYLFPPLATNATNKAEYRQRSGWYQPLEHSTFTHWKAEASTVDLDLDAYEKRRKEEKKQKKKK